MKISFKLRVIALTMLISMTIASILLFVIRERIINTYIEDLNVHLCIESRRLTTFGKPEQMDRYLGGLTSRLKLNSLHELAVNYSAKDSTASWATDHPPTPIEQLKNLHWEEPKDDLFTGDRTRLDQTDDRESKCEISKFEVGNVSWRAGRTLGQYGDAYITANFNPAQTYIDTKYIIPSALFLLTTSLLLSLFGGLLLSKYTLRPLDRVRSAMKLLDNSRSNFRINQSDKVPEHEELFRAFNQMVDTIESNYAQAARFSSDAAHELKTPLTILRGRIEMEYGSSKDEKEIIFSIDLQVQINRLISITSKLLLLSKLDSRQTIPLNNRIIFSDFLNDLVDEFSSYHESVKCDFHIEEGIELYSDRELLRTLFTNILGNAFSYCRAGGVVTVCAELSQNGTQVIISNDSQVISAASRLRMFDRFYRGDEIRPTDSESSGLGLNLACEIAKCFGGRLTLEPSSEDIVIIQVWLPLKKT